MLDPFLLAAVIPRPIRYLGKSELWKVPGLRWWLGSVEAIPVHRGGSDIAAIASAIEALEAGEVVGIFPEGGVKREGPGSAARPGWRSRRERRCCPCGCSTPGRRSGGTIAFPPLAALIGEPIAVERAEPTAELARELTDRLQAAVRRSARSRWARAPPGLSRAAGTLGRCQVAASEQTAERPERPADPAVRKANLRRIFPLFRSYRPQLAVVFALIIFSALLGVIPSFLLEESSTRRSPRTTCACSRLSSRG